MPYWLLFLSPVIVLFPHVSSLKYNSVFEKWYSILHHSFSGYQDPQFPLLCVDLEWDDMLRPKIQFWFICSPFCRFGTNPGHRSLMFFLTYFTNISYWSPFYLFNHINWELTTCQVLGIHSRTGQDKVLDIVDIKCPFLKWNPLLFPLMYLFISALKLFFWPETRH